MSGSDTLSTFIDAAAVPAAVATAVCAAQTTAGIANLVINGSLATGGVATLVPARNVTVTTASDNTGINFLVTGFLADGTVLTETITGPDAGLTVSTTSLFSKVDKVAVSGAITGNATVGTGTSVIGTVFAGRARVRGIYFVTTSTAGTIAITNGPTGGGEIGVKFATSGGANSADYPSMPDEGVVYSNGAYVVYTSTAVTGITVFYN